MRVTRGDGDHNMKVRHIVGIAILGGLIGNLGGQAAQAQTSSQARFVSMLIMKEATLIYKNRVAIAQQNQSEQNLTLLIAGDQTGRTRRTIANLQRSVNKLQNMINNLTSRLSALNIQVTASVRTLPAPNPYQQPAALNTQVIQSFVNRRPFGIPPSSTIQ